MPTPGFFELYPKARPPLPAGAYLLAADQELVATPPHNASGDLAVDGSDFTFKIVSPRYVMPPEQILSTFPPAEAVGDWRERLPQIVFKRRTMPWERNPGSGTFDETTPPWLALVVLAEGEGTLSGEVDVAQCVTAPRHLAGDADTSKGRYLEVTQTIVKKIFPTIEDLHLLCHVRKVDLSDTELALGDDDGYLAVVMANRLPQPGPPAEPGGDPTSRRYTAYLVNLEAQLDDLPTKEESETVFDFVVDMAELVDTGLLLAPGDVGPIHSADAVVMHGLTIGAIAPLAAPEGARPIVAPQEAGGGTAGAVQAYGGASGIEAAGAAYATGPAMAAGTVSNDVRQVNQWLVGTPLVELAELSATFGRTPEKRFRFPVLVSWDFVCTGEGGFERLMNRLDSGMLGTIDPDADPALLPDVSVTGHISLHHRTRRGEAAESWYRGPFVPQPTTRLQPDALAHTGDQLRRVVPDGHEDVGPAAAFEIGRLLALSKPGIVGALLAWREELFGAARARSLAAELADVILAGIADSVGAGKRRLDDLIATELLVPYAERVPDLVGPRAKEFGVSRVPAEMAKLDVVDTLAGLGLDANVVMDATATLGLAGLATVDVNVAPIPEGPLSGWPADLAGLRALADAQLDQLASETLKLGTLTQQPAPKRARRRAPKDGLDRLLDAAVAGATEEDDDA